MSKIHFFVQSVTMSFNTGIIFDVNRIEILETFFLQNLNVSTNT